MRPIINLKTFEQYSLLFECILLQVKVSDIVSKTESLFYFAPQPQSEPKLIPFLTFIDLKTPLQLKKCYNSKRMTEATSVMDFIVILSDQYKVIIE
jgi:hypothetical protein